MTRSSKYGYIVMSFSIDERGKPVKIAVIESSSDLLEDAALEAVSKRAYVPRRQNGEPVLTEGMRTRVDFEAP